MATWSNQTKNSASWTNQAENPAVFDTQYLDIGDGFNLVIGDTYILKIQTAGEIWANLSRNSASWANQTKN